MLAAASSFGLREAAILGFVMLAMVFVGTVVIPWVRRRFHPANRAASVDSGFKVDELEAMWRDGRISEQEFRVLRRAALGLGMEVAKTDNSASSPPLAGDDDEVTVEPSGESPGAAGDKE